MESTVDVPVDMQVYSDEDFYDAPAGAEDCGTYVCILAWLYGLSVCAGQFCPLGCEVCTLCHQSCEAAALLPLAAGEISRIVQDRWSALHIAVGRNDTCAIDALLVAKVDVDATTTAGWTPLMLAYMNEHQDAVCALRRHGVGVTAKCVLGNTAADYAQILPAP